jgi:hypothetical protein
MLTTSDPDATRAAFARLDLPFEEHGSDVPGMEGMTIADLRGR